MNILGIDPGQSGGMAFLPADDSFIGLVAKMPETERDLWDLLKDWLEIGINYAFLEAVHAMPQQGVSSTFKFGQHYGMLRGFLIALGVPFETVSPAVWQRKLGCLSHGNKNITKAKAQELFPSLHITHATADALLIAHYGCQKHGGTQ